MGVSVKKSWILIIDGKTVVLSDEEMQKVQATAKTENELTLVCDSPRCGSRFDASGPTTRTWTVEDAQNNPDNVPDDANRFIPVNNGQVACSKQCLKDWAEYCFVPAPSPKELRAKMEEEKKKQAEELKVLNPHLVQAPAEPVQMRTEYHVSELPATLPPHCGDTVKVVTTPVVEVPALCQNDEEGYGHGV
jgi:hypothetical protein